MYVNRVWKKLERTLVKAMVIMALPFAVLNAPSVLLSPLRFIQIVFLGLLTGFITWILVAMILSIFDGDALD